MLLIPVIDVMDGRVVHAMRGERATYRPIHSLLCQQTDPLSVVSALLNYYPFRRLYVADLDAITKGPGDNARLIVELAHCYPALQLWVDAGRRAAAPAPWRAVLGTECLQPGEALPESAVLSLDFKNNRLLGPSPDASLSTKVEDVIVMNLDRVGSAQGPDLEQFRSLRRQWPRARLHLAGGLRDRADLQRAASCGADGVLMATCLHQRTMTPADLRDFDAAA